MNWAVIGCHKQAFSTCYLDALSDEIMCAEFSNSAFNSSYLVTSHVPKASTTVSHKHSLCWLAGSASHQLQQV